MELEKATFAAGCFWGVEATFLALLGVGDTAVGYLGGQFPDPTYQDVCSGQTGHAEAVEVTFDPALIRYETLLEVFWGSHDPTTLNRQGSDVGSQYRSVIFCHSDEQAAAAAASKLRAGDSGRFPGPIVTEIMPVPAFYRAEEYHQRYLEKNSAAQCRVL